MSQSPRQKGRKTISRRLVLDDEFSETPIKEAQSLQALFDVFIKAKEIEGLRERTLNDHHKHFRYFTEFLGKFEPSISKAQEVTVNTIRSYIHYMKNDKQLFESHPWLADFNKNNKGLSPVTINVRLRSLKCFFKFLYDEGHIPTNPCEKIKLLKTESDTIESFSKEQVQQLLAQPDLRTFVGYRDYGLMLLMLDTGIRISEALNLKTYMFNFEQKTITIPAHIAKNKQARVLPVSKKTAKVINTLIKENGALEEKQDYIFITNYGEKLQPYVMRKRISHYGEKAKIHGVRVSPHTFRHTFAKFYILNGGDAFTLQRLLDHSTMNMVRKYIQMNHEDIKIQHNQFSPVSNLFEQ